MRPTTRIAHRTLRTALAAALAVFLSHGAAADLMGHTEVRAAVAGKSDEALVAANPALERLGRESPALLGEVLARLRAPAPEPSYRRSLGSDQARPATQAETAVLAENPDLSQYYRESPEAALDLLRLIREAAKKR